MFELSLLFTEVTATFLLILLVLTLVIISYYFGKKVDRWQVNYQTVEAGVWIKTEQPIDCYAGKSLAQKQVLPAGMLAKVTHINNQRRLHLKLANPINVDGEEVLVVWDVKAYDKFRIVPESLVEEAEERNFSINSDQAPEKKIEAEEVMYTNPN